LGGGYETKKEEIVEWLEKYCPVNKARGLLAQLKFVSEFRKGVFAKYSSKYYKGCWILAPGDEEFYKARFCFFVHGKEVERDSVSDNTLNPDDVLGEGEGLRFRMVAGFLSRAGVIPVYAFLTTEERWVIFYYDKDTEFLKKLDPEGFFGKWHGRGRPGRNREGWDYKLRRSYLEMDTELLLELYLYERFFTEFLKAIHKVSIRDPYDIDGFILSPSLSAVMPVEIKEKFPGKERSGEKYFGIDVGRVLMLLRFCLPTDMNAFYIVREVTEDEARNFVAWKYVLLSDIIMAASWNPLGGGRGMGGQKTYTVRIPYNVFNIMDSDTISDGYLKQVMNLPRKIKIMAKEFYRYAKDEYIGS
jgi:hypothetical protein